MRFTLLILFTAILLTACPEEKEPSFPPLDAEISDVQSEREETVPTTCTDHGDCGSNEVCFERECVDIEDVVDDCWDDSDCPDDWVCIDQDYCEEE